MNARIGTPQPGDAVFAATRDLYGRLIGLAEWFPWRKGSKWHHMAIVVSNDGGKVMVVQMARRCELVPIEDVAPGGEILVVEPPAGVDVDRAVAYAKTLVGIRYAVLVIACIFINLFTPRALRVDFRRDGSLICSSLVARAYEHGGWVCPMDPFQIAPAEMWGAW